MNDFAKRFCAAMKSNRTEIELSLVAAVGAAVAKSVYSAATNTIGGNKGVSADTKKK